MTSCEFKKNTCKKKKGIWLKTKESVEGAPKQVGAIWRGEKKHWSWDLMTYTVAALMSLPEFSRTHFM